jgi:hypothetical protein
MRDPRAPEGLRNPLDPRAGRAIRLPEEDPVQRSVFDHAGRLYE